MLSIMRRRNGLISAIENSCLMRWFGNPTLSDRRPRRQLPLPEAVSFNPHSRSEACRFLERDGDCVAVCHDLHPNPRIIARSAERGAVLPTSILSHPKGAGTVRPASLAREIEGWIIPMNADLQTRVADRIQQAGIADLKSAGTRITNLLAE
jgi:hypothetical protein